MRKTIRTLVSVGALMPTVAFALGLGQLRVESALNQPLDARIDLLAVQPEELPDIRVQLASAEAYAQAGLDRPFALTSVRFQIKEGKGGRYFVEMSTRNPVREPALNLLLEVRWSRGRLQRQFPILLDPPSLFFRPTSTPTIDRPGASAAPGREPTRPSTPTPSRDTRAVPSEYQVRRGDTLGQIARRVKPDSGMSDYQMMIALQRRNPGAFINGNVNLLRSGVTLQVPSADEIRQQSAGAAREEFNRQVRAWKGQSTQSASAAPIRAPRPSGSTSSVLDDDPLAPLDELDSGEDRVVVSDERPQVAPSLGGAETERMVQEALAAQRKEFEAKLNAKDVENNELREKIEAQSDQLVALSEQIDKLREAVLAGRPEGGSAPALVQPAVAPTPVKGAESTASGEDQNMLFWGGGGALFLLLLLLGGWLFMRRRNEEEQGAEIQIDDAAVAAAGSAAPLRPAELAGGDTVVMPPAAPTQAVALTPEPAAGEERAAIEEADALIAYGLYNQAADFIKEKLKATPDDHQLRVKLLEVYQAGGNRQAFESEAQQLYNQIGNSDPVTWERAAVMGRVVAPDNPLFGASEAAAADEDDIGDVGASSVSEVDMSEFADLEFESVDLEELGIQPSGDSALDVSVSSGDKPGIDTEVSVESDLRQGQPDDDFLTAGLPDLDVDHIAAPSESSEGISQVSGLDRDLQELENIELGAPPAAGDAGSPAALESEPMETVLEDFLASEAPRFGAQGAAAFETAAGDEEISIDDSDEIATKLDLARAFMDMGDPDGAKATLEEVLEEGNDTQKQEARDLLASLG